MRPHAWVATTSVCTRIPVPRNTGKGAPLAPSTVNSYFYKVLHCAEPAVVTAGAIAIGKRVVNVLYGHAPSLTQPQLAALQQICRVAAEAYARLIAVSKQKR